MTSFDNLTDFNKIMAVEAAVMDRPLRYFYWDRIYGNLPATPEAHDRIADEVCHVHNLSDDQYRQVLPRVIGEIVGIQTGREFFRDGN